jgi:energy-coupling factor transport system substrate-specific component
MTWQMASFALLAIVLVIGFAWYERTHPSAKVLALVATLAALAVLGRMAFAPLPQVKPTTDIILLSGYVLGGAPGFAVGAVTALASNFFFGQGPYTPWQMVAWGGVGLFGALLAVTFGRELGRWSLALACGAAGLAYGLVMDLSQWVTFSGHSLGELGVLLGKGLPFNVAHAVANVAFCVAFGPVLVTALRRFRDRFEITWHPAPVAGSAVLAVVMLLTLAPAANAAEDRAVGRAMSYLEAAQTKGGGWAEKRGAKVADPIASGWVALAYGATKRNPGKAGRAFLAREARKVTDVGDIERTLLALAATGQPATSIHARLERKRRRDGSYEELVNRTAFALLSAKAVRKGPPKGTVKWLLDQQNTDGGWSVAGKGGPSGVDDTAVVIQGLVAAGEDGAAVDKAADWLVRQQQPDGGFPLTPGAPTNAQSTAFVVQALLAADRDPSKVRTDGSRSPEAYLRTLQNPDGSFRYSRTSRQTPTWVTAQVVTALAERPLPIRAPLRRNVGKPTGLQGFVALVTAALL